MITRLQFLTVVTLAASSATLSTAHASSVSFPGPIKELPSPHGRLRVDYVDPGENADGIHLYQLRLRYPDGRIEKLDEFTREVEVAWSPSGDRLFTTNYIGSNVADCLVVTPEKTRVVVRSITDAVRRSRISGISKDLGGDHVYVGCEGWISPHAVDIDMEGDWFPRGFKHHLIYDAVTGRISTPSRVSSKKR